MKPFSDTEIQRRLNKLERLLLETFGFSVKIVEGVPTTDGSEAEGDVVYDSTNGNLYVFDGNSFNLGSEQIHFGYASDVQNTNDQGLVSAASDVTSFSTNPSVNGVALPWEGKFIGSTIPTAVTQYTWTNVKGEQGDQGVQGIQGVPGEAAVKVFQISISEPSIPSDSVSTPVGWLANPTTTGLGDRTTQDGGVIQFTLNPTGNFDQTYVTGFPAGFLQTTQNSRTEIRFFNNANRTGATLEDANNVILGLFVSDNALTLSEKLAEYAELLNNWANGSVNVGVSGGNLIFYSNDLLVQMSTPATVATSPDNDFVAASAILTKNLISKLWSVSGTRPTISSNYTWTDLILESGTEGAQGVAGANIIDYSDLVQYDIGDLVGYDDTQWRALASIPSTNTIPPAENSSWSQIATIAQAGDAGSGEENVQSDWTEAVTSVDSFIKNKPTTITGTQSDAITANTNKRTYPSVDQTKLGTIPTLPTGIPTDTSKEYILKLTDIEGNETATWEQGTGGSGETNVQSNWTETTITSDSFIQNKPTTISGVQSDAITANSLKTGFTELLAQDALDISDDGDILTYKNKTGVTQTFEPSGSGDANVQSDWTETTTSDDSFIKNKPTTITSGQASAIVTNTAKVGFTAALARDALNISDSGNTLTYTDASDSVQTWSPTGSGDANVQSDWTETTTSDDSFIKNKPTTITSGQASAITANTSKVGITTGQASAITANTSKVGFTAAAARDALNISDSGNTLTYTDASDSVQTWTPTGTGDDNVQADWSETTTSDDSFIKNKPTTITGTQSNAITANSLKVGFTAPLARDAVAISDNGDTLTYTDSSDTIQTFTPTGAGSTSPQAEVFDLVFSVQSSQPEAYQLVMDFSYRESESLILGDYVVVSVPSGSGNTSASLATLVKTAIDNISGTSYLTTSQPNTSTVRVAWDATGRRKDMLVYISTLSLADGFDTCGFTVKTLIETQGRDTGVSYTDLDATTAVDLRIFNGSLSFIDKNSRFRNYDLQSDWTETTATDVSFIKNKPTTITSGQASAIVTNTSKVGFTNPLARDALAISDDGSTLTYTDNSDVIQTFTPLSTGENNVQSDWSETTITDDSFIKNKPTTITTDQVTKLAGIDTGAEVNVQPDWNVSSNFSDSYIKNKPTVVQEYKTTDTVRILNVAIPSNSTGATDSITFASNNLETYVLSTPNVITMILQNGTGSGVSITGGAFKTLLVTNSDPLLSLSAKIDDWASTITNSTDIKLTAYREGSSSIRFIDKLGGTLISNGSMGFFDSFGFSFGSETAIPASSTSEPGLIFQKGDVAQHGSKLWQYISNSELITEASTEAPAENLIWSEFINRASYVPIFEVSGSNAVADQVFRLGNIVTQSGNGYMYFGSSVLTTTTSSALPSAGGDWKQLT